MEDYAPDTIETEEFENETWSARLGNSAPIVLIVAVLLALAGIAISNHCSTGCTFI